ncbi:MAG: YhfC family glutamic-type intramembrane protease, partial [Oscillospiraceae bacterium]
PVLNGLFLAVTAAIFEEFGRYIVMKLFLKKRRRFYDAVSFGFGHGGIEAILFVGINTLATFLMYGTLMASAENVFLSGVERLGTMVFHIFMSVLVMYSVSAKKPIYLVFALLAHTAVDFFLPQMMRAGVNIWLIEGLNILVALVCLVLIVMFKNKFKKLESEKVINEKVIEY